MSSSNRDQDRFRRIRDQQLASRDPLIKQRKLDRSIAEKHRRAQMQFNLGQIWREVPHKWRDMLGGAVLGVIIVIAFPSLVPGTWSVCIGLGAFVFVTLLGFLIGRYEDTKEDVEDLAGRL
jgi:hypothetical protein